MFKHGDRVKVRGIVRFGGTVDTIESAPSGKAVVMVDLDNGMTMPCFEEELTRVPTPVTVLDVVIHHEGWVYRVTSAPVPEHVTLHLAFRNVVAKQHFCYAMRTAWPQVTVINRAGTVNVSIVVPLGA